MRAFQITAALAATSLAFAGFAYAQGSSEIQYYALLDGSNAVPAVETGGTGEAEFMFDTGSMTLSWTVTYDGLSGPLTGAFVHGPAGAGERAPIILILTRDLSGPIEGTASLTETQAEQLADGQWYVNLRTAEHPSGEIRGTIVAEVIEAGEPRADDMGDMDAPAEPMEEEPEAGDEPAIENEPIMPEEEPMAEPEEPMEPSPEAGDAMAGADEPAAEEAPMGDEAMAASVASYTEEQADRGQDAYRQNCAGCHGRTLGGDAESPALAGGGFRDRWFNGQVAAAFYGYISNAMPQQAPGSLEPQTYADIMAYILEVNGYPAGETELPADMQILMNLPIPERGN